VGEFFDLAKRLWCRDEDTCRRVASSLYAASEEEGYAPVECCRSYETVSTEVTMDRIECELQSQLRSLGEARPVDDNTFLQMMIHNGAQQLNTAINAWVRPEGPRPAWLLEVCLEALAAWEREYKRQYELILTQRTHRPWRIGASDRMLLFPGELRETKELLQMYQELHDDDAL